MEIQQFIRNFENAIEGIQLNSLAVDTNYHTLSQWDSLGLLCLLAMIDCEYNVQISGMELKHCTTLGDIFNLVESKL